MAARRTRRSPGKKQKSTPPKHQAVEGAQLEPIRVVERELTCPDGTRVTVKVPVYPPFRLQDRAAEGPDQGKRAKKAG